MIGNSEVRGIKAVVESLNEDDYKQFPSIRSARYAELEYDRRKPIGFSYCFQYIIDDEEEKLGSLGVGICVAINPNYREKGIARKLVLRILESLDNDPEITEIIWVANKTNKPSIGTAKTCGFEHWYDYENDTVYRYRKK